MDTNSILIKTENYVKEKLSGECTGHDYWHIERVRKTALNIGRTEGADLFIVEMAALLHDIGDYKIFGGDEIKGLKVIEDFLKKLDIEEKTFNSICNIVKNISFKGALVQNEIVTIEGKVVQDADRLDALGAIGIARAFAYGGFKGQEIYNPDLIPKKHRTFEEYKESKSSTINHFYEKLLLLKGLMNTETGKNKAEERHQFMQLFLEKFYLEWEGEI